MKCKVKVQETLYRPGQDLSVSAGWGSQISRQFSHGDKVVGLTHRPPLPQGIFLVLISVDLRVIVRTEGLCKLKIPIAQLEIEPVSFRLRAQCHLRYALFGNNFVPEGITKTAAIRRTWIDQLQSVVSDWWMKSVVDLGVEEFGA